MCLFSLEKAQGAISWMYVNTCRKGVKNAEPYHFSVAPSDNELRLKGDTL